MPTEKGQDFSADERKKTMKKFTRLMALVLALIMTMSLFACGKPAAGNEGNEANKPARQREHCCPRQQAC